MKKLTEESGHTFVDIESYQALETQIKNLVELVNEARPIVMAYKYTKQIDKRTDDVKWVIEWQEKAEEILGIIRNY